MPFLIETAPTNSWFSDGGAEWSTEATVSRRRAARAYIIDQSIMIDELGDHTDGRGRRYSDTAWALQRVRVRHVDRHGISTLVDMDDLMDVND